MATEAARDAITGFWNLISYEDRESEAHPWTQTFGTKPRGVGVYHPSGMLSMQVFADSDAGSTVGFVGYIGTFRMREAHRDADGFSGIVEHRMESASDPDLLTEDVERPFNVSSGQLVLGDGRTWRRTFERIP